MLYPSPGCLSFASASLGMKCRWNLEASGCCSMAADPCNETCDSLQARSYFDPTTINIAAIMPLAQPHKSSFVYGSFSSNSGSGIEGHSSVGKGGGATPGGLDSSCTPHPHDCCSKIGPGQFDGERSVGCLSAGSSKVTHRPGCPRGFPAAHQVCRPNCCLVALGLQR